MTPLTLKVTRASVITGLPGTDILTLYLDAPTPFPEMGYEANLRTEVRKGYGVEYCRTVFGIEPEIIQAGR